MKLNLVAALLGRSNYGQPALALTHHAFWWAKKGEDCPDLGAAVSAVVGDICENDDHYDMFHDEAKSFYDGLKGKTADEAIAIYPSLAQYKEMIQ